MVFTYLPMVTRCDMRDPECIHPGHGQKIAQTSQPSVALASVLLPIPIFSAMSGYCCGQLFSRKWHLSIFSQLCSVCRQSCNWDMSTVQVRQVPLHLSYVANLYIMSIPTQMLISSTTNKPLVHLSEVNRLYVLHWSLKILYLFVFLFCLPYWPLCKNFVLYFSLWEI